MHYAASKFARLAQLCLAAGALQFAACGSTHTPGDSTYAASVAPGTRAPADKVEELILQQLGDLAANEPQTIDGHSVTAGPRYSAASGRDCRTIHIGGSSARSSLACLMPSGWAFVPNVFEAEPGSS